LESLKGWKASWSLSQRLIMTLLSHQLLRMPTCGSTKDGAVVVPRQAMRGTDTKMRCKANWLVQKKNALRLFLDEGKEL
jgi:hypothetical protein